MTSLQQIIQRQLNPFDRSSFRPGNFWQESQNTVMEVDTIHGEILDAISHTLQQISTDHKTQTLLLTGDSGAGKSYLLGRLKRQLNDNAFFAYIGPWPDSNYLWRHTLRNVVDSLVKVPEGQSESQMLLWLKGISSLHQRSLAKWVLGERGKFIQDLHASFPVVYNGREFFGVLYDLATNPELRILAYAWLKGDNLDKEELKTLRVKQPIDSEDAAQKILNNIGRIATSTQPIVLCFDNLDSIPRLANNKPDLQRLFHLNTTIHNENLHNFLVLISIVTGTWREYRKQIQPADEARINDILRLKRINLDQAEALWASRLAPLHAQVTPTPETEIAPLSHDWLAHAFPGKRTLPRTALDLGRRLITHYKQYSKLPDKSVSPPPPSPSPPPALKPSFQLIWDKEFQANQKAVTRIGQFTSPELIWRLRQVLEALEVSQIETQFLQGSKYASYSLSHRHKKLKMGIVWNEDPNMNTFFHVMKACQKAIDKDICDCLYLIRAAGTGKSKTKGNQIYYQIFNGKASYAHFQPDLLSVQYLETYHQLASAARAGELVLGDQTPHLKDLQAVVRESGVLDQCPLLQKLQIVEGDLEPTPPSQAVADYIVNLMATQSFIGLLVLIETTRQQFSNIKEQEIEQEIQTLCDQKRLQLLDPQASREAQLICYVPA